MTIILEGCECTGKTTLADKLSWKYSLKYKHITNSDPNTCKFYRKTMKENDVVFDRHFIGEMIYPHIYNRKPNLSVRQLNNLFKLSKKLGVHIFVLTAKANTLFERYKKRGKKKEDFITSKFVSINNWFMRLASSYSDYITVIDENTTFEDVCKIIKEKEHKKCTTI